MWGLRWRRAQAVLLLQLLLHHNRLVFHVFPVLPAKIRVLSGVQCADLNATTSCRAWCLSQGGYPAQSQASKPAKASSVTISTGSPVKQTQLHAERISKHIEKSWERFGSGFQHISASFAYQAPPSRELRACSAFTLLREMLWSMMLYDVVQHNTTVH